MADVNDVLQDQLIFHSAVDLTKIEQKLQRQALLTLKELEKELVGKVAALDLTGPGPPSVKARRLAALTRQTADSIEKYTGKVSRDLKAALSKIAQLEAQYTAGALNAALGGSAASVALSPEKLASLVNRCMVEGKVVKDWWAKQAKDLRANFLREMKLGIAQNETLDQLTKRARGLFPREQRNVRALVRTAQAQLAMDARMAQYKEMGDLIAGFKFSATIDDRTTPICQACDGAVLNKDMQVVEGAAQAKEPPLHWNCRSILVPITKSWEQLAADFGSDPEKMAKYDKVIPTRTRASMGGKIPVDQDYSTWLRGKPDAFQDMILGPERAQLFRDGKVSHLSQLLDTQGKLLSPDDLLTAIREGELVDPITGGLITGGTVVPPIVQPPPPPVSEIDMLPDAKVMSEAEKQALIKRLQQNAFQNDPELAESQLRQFTFYHGTATKVDDLEGGLVALADEVNTHPGISLTTNIDEALSYGDNLLEMDVHMLGGAVEVNESFWKGTSRWAVHKKIYELVKNPTKATIGELSEAIELSGYSGWYTLKGVDIGELRIFDPDDIQALRRVQPPKKIAPAAVTLETLQDEYKAAMAEYDRLVKEGNYSAATEAHKAMREAKTRWVTALPEEEYQFFRRQLVEQMMYKKDLKDAVLFDTILKGTNYLPYDVLETMVNNGIKITIHDDLVKKVSKGGIMTKEKFRAWYQSYGRGKDRAGVHLSNKTTTRTVSHEFGHAADDILWTRGYMKKQFGKKGTGLIGKRDTEFIDKKTIQSLRKEFESMHGYKGQGTYTNGDGQFWKDEWIHNYEGRIYGSGSKTANMGEEWIAMNMERYAKYIRKLNEGASESTALSLSDWGLAKKKYPLLAKFIEDNFGNNRTYRRELQGKVD